MPSPDVDEPPEAAARPAAPRPRVPASAIVPVGRTAPPPGAIVLRLRREMPLRHGLMLALALAVMALGAVSAHKHPIQRAIIVLPPELQGAVVT